MENMPATGGGIPLQLRRLVLLGTPLVLGILEIWHPTSNESTFDLIVDNANWWFTLHILQLPLFGLMALAVYLLVDGLQGWAATISRIGAWFFVVFYIALDSIVGIAGGVIARGARGLPADQQALIARQLEEFAFDPTVGGGGLSLLGILGPLGWVVAAVGAAIALRRVGLPLGPTILIGASAIFAVIRGPPAPWALRFSCWEQGGPSLFERVGGPGTNRHMKDCACGRDCANFAITEAHKFAGIGTFTESWMPVLPLRGKNSRTGSSRPATESTMNTIWWT